MWTRTWMVTGCLLLASCVEFSSSSPASNDEATTTKPGRPAPSSTASSAATATATASPTSAASPAATATDAAALWPVTGGTVPIAVCFESGFSDADKDLAKSAAESFWNENTPLDFTGWHDCDANDSTSVRLTPVTSGRSHVEHMGAAARGSHVSLLVNQSQNAYASDVLHELGHVAGLGHEDLSDMSARATCSAIEAANGIADDLPAPAPAGRGVDDSDSIMSRCRRTDEPDLSSADVATVARLYGAAASANVGGDVFQSGH